MASALAMEKPSEFDHAPIQKRILVQMKQITDTGQFCTEPHKIQASGYCVACRTEHRLHMGEAENAAVELIETLDREKRIDFHVSKENADPRFSTDYLFGKARGKMFGVLVCQDRDGGTVRLKSFSGQYNGVWVIAGWAPPLFDLEQWHRVNDSAEKAIKKMGVAINSSPINSPDRKKMVYQRKNKSRELMKALHMIYSLHNFRGQNHLLRNAYTGKNGIPNGTADCCGPKLLNIAARKKLRPLGLAEFYYGRENRQGNRTHRHFYASCKEKCAPILGYLLCGLAEME